MGGFTGLVSSPDGDHTMRGRRGLGTRSADAYLCCLLYSVLLFLLGICPHIDLYGFSSAESSDSVDESSVQNILVVFKCLFAACGHLGLLDSCRTIFWIFMDTWAQYQ